MTLMEPDTVILLLLKFSSCSDAVLCFGFRSRGRLGNYYPNRIAYDARVVILLIIFLLMITKFGNKFYSNVWCDTKYIEVNAYRQKYIKYHLTE